MFCMFKSPASENSGRITGRCRTEIIARMGMEPKDSDTLGDFIRRLPRSAKIADIRHVRYRRVNSPAFAKCARSRDFLRLLLRIASKANPSGWAILSHEFSKLPHCRDRRKKSPGVSDFRWRSNSPRSAYKIARCVAGLRPYWFHSSFQDFTLEMKFGTVPRSSSLQ